MKGVNELEQKKTAGEELLALAEEFTERAIDVKYAAADDDYDAGYKNGYKKALSEANDTIYKRLEILLGELKQK